MADFPKFKEYLAAIYDPNGKVDDLEPYLNEKSNLLGELLLWYTQELEKASENSAFVESRSIIDDSTMIIVFHEILKADYKPPFPSIDLPHNVQTHLKVLHYFYGSVRPVKLNLSTILRLDISTLKLSAYISGMAQSWKSVRVKIDRVQGIKRGKAEQFKQSSNDILEAYNDLKARWLDDEHNKPILVDGERYSLNKFVNRCMIGLQGVDLDPKTIVTHLKQLKKDGTI